MSEKHKEPEKHKDQKHPAKAAKPAAVKDHEAGIEQEHNDLAVRIEKLNEFLVLGEFNAVSPEDKALIHKQHDIMNQYLEILQQRIQHHNEGK